MSSSLSQRLIGRRLLFRLGLSLSATTSPPSLHSPIRDRHVQLLQLFEPHQPAAPAPATHHAIAYKPGDNLALACDMSLAHRHVPFGSRQCWLVGHCRGPWAESVTGLRRRAIGCGPQHQMNMAWCSLVAGGRHSPLFTPRPRGWGSLGRLGPPSLQTTITESNSAPWRPLRAVVLRTAAVPPDTAAAGCWLLRPVLATDLPSTAGRAARGAGQWHRGVIKRAGQM